MIAMQLLNTELKFSNNEGNKEELSRRYIDFINVKQYYELQLILKTTIPYRKQETNTLKCKDKLNFNKLNQNAL